MGSTISHRDRANKNGVTQDILRDNNINKVHSDWIVPIACYRAIHIIEAFCDIVGEHFTTHNERLDFVKRRSECNTSTPDGRSVYTSFRFLTTLCQQAMEMHNVVIDRPEDEWKRYFDDALESKVIQEHLSRIESFARNHGIDVSHEQHLPRKT